MIAAATQANAKELRDLLMRAKTQMQQGDRASAATIVANLSRHANLSKLDAQDQGILAELRVLLGPTAVEKPRRKRRKSGT